MNDLSLRIKRSLFSVALASTLFAGGATTALFGVSPAPALAQDQPNAGAPAGGQHGHRMGEILKSLNLSDAQKTQIRGIIADARKQNENVTDRDQKHANMKAAYGKVEAVLTPAQRTEFHAKLDAARQQDQAPHS